MTTFGTTGRVRPKAGNGLRAAGRRFLGDVAARYLALRRRLADMLMRGDRDYALLSALSQEIGRMRQRIRTDLQRRRRRRTRHAAADVAKLVAPGEQSP